MSTFSAGVAASVVASAITYLVFAATDALSPPLRLLAIGVVLVVGIVVAWKASRKASGGPKKGTKVGSDIKAKGNITVENVEAKGLEGTTEVATDLRSRKDVRVTGVKVSRARER